MTWWLSFAALAFVLASWASTFLLARAAWIKPRIGALTERALIGVMLSTTGTVGLVLRFNAEAGFPLFPLEVGRVIFVLSLLWLLVVPVSWLGLYITGRLGDGS